MRVGTFSVFIPQGVERDSGHVRLPHGTQYTINLVSHDPSPADAEVTVDGKPVGVFRVPAQAKVPVETPVDDPNHGCFTFYRADSDEGEVAGAGTTSDDRGLIRIIFRPGKLRRAVSDQSDNFKRILEEVERGRWRSKSRPWNGPITPDYPPPPRPGREYFDVTCSSSESGNASGVLRAATPTGFSSVGAFSDWDGSENTAGPGPEAASGVTGLSGTSDQRWKTAEPIDYTADKEVTITLRLVAIPKVQAVRPIPPASLARANPVPVPVDA